MSSLLRFVQIQIQLLPFVAALLAIPACGGKAQSDPTGDAPGAANGAPAAARTPDWHRPTAEPCTPERENVSPGACLTDNDCSAGQLCSCKASYDFATRHPVSRCIATNCRLDADCGPQGFCSPESDSYTSPWSCHTPEDDCLKDADCPVDKSCVYEASEKKWSCGSRYHPNLRP